MSSTTAEVGRRDLGGRQADRVDALVVATLDELRAHGYEGLTVRNAARRAGVAAATAYTYFGSKDHLVAEVFWRRLSALPPVRVDRRRSPAARVAAALADIGALAAEEPALASACTTAVLAADPDVAELRDRIGALFARRIADGIGPEADRDAVEALVLCFTGAMLQAGIGYFPYTEVVDRVGRAAELMLR